MSWLKVLSKIIIMSRKVKHAREEPEEDIAKTEETVDAIRCDPQIVEPPPAKKRRRPQKKDRKLESKSILKPQKIQEDYVAADEEKSASGDYMVLRSGLRKQERRKPISSDVMISLPEQTAINRRSDEDDNKEGVREEKEKTVLKGSEELVTMADNDRKLHVSCSQKDINRLLEAAILPNRRFLTIPCKKSEAKSIVKAMTTTDKYFPDKHWYHVTNDSKTYCFECNERPSPKRDDETVVLAKPVLEAYPHDRLTFRGEVDDLTATLVFRNPTRRPVCYRLIHKKKEIKYDFSERCEDIILPGMTAHISLRLRLQLPIRYEKVDTLILQHCYSQSNKYVDINTVFKNAEELMETRLLVVVEPAKIHLRQAVAGPVYNEFYYDEEVEKKRFEVQRPFRSAMVEEDLDEDEDERFEVQRPFRSAMVEEDLDEILKDAMVEEDLDEIFKDEESANYPVVVEPGHHSRPHASYTDDKGKKYVFRQYLSLGKDYFYSCATKYCTMYIKVIGDHFARDPTKGHDSYCEEELLGD